MLKQLVFLCFGCWWGNHLMTENFNWSSLMIFDGEPEECDSVHWQSPAPQALRLERWTTLGWRGDNSFSLDRPLREGGQSR